MKRFGILVLFLLAQQGLSADRPAGRVVWWGSARVDPMNPHTRNTNGVVEVNREILTKAKEVAAFFWIGVALTSD